MAQEVVTRKEIGRELYKDFGETNDNKDASIDRFYMLVRVKFTDQELNIGDEALKILREIKPDCKWRKVTPVEDIPGLFYGQYKKDSETEREREKKLDDVRRKLKTKLGEILSKHSRGATDQTKPEIIVLLTRACLYSPDYMNTSD